MRHFVRTARRVGIGVATPALVLALAATGCGDPDAESTGTESTGAARPTSTSPASTGPGPATTTTAPGLTSPTTGAGTPTTPTTVLGPEWVQQDGRVLIEAVASGDPQNLLSDLVALGLIDGVVVGRLVNGWLPIESFEAAKRLGTLQFVQPTGAGTG